MKEDDIPPYFNPYTDKIDKERSIFSTGEIPSKKIWYDSKYKSYFIWDENLKIYLSVIGEK